MAITHTFVSAKADSTDTTLVRPSNWNDDHTIAAKTPFTTPVIASLYQVSTGGLITVPASAGADTICLIGATQELAAKTLNASVAKGTWTASGTWTIPAVTLGGAVAGGGQSISNILNFGITGVATLAGNRTNFSGLDSNHHWLRIGGVADTNAMVGWEVVTTLFTMVNKAPAATAGNTLYDSAFELRGEYWDGSESKFYMVRHLWDLTATTPAGTYSIEVPYLTPRLSITSAGAITFPNNTGFTLPATTLSGNLSAGAHVINHVSELQFDENAVSYMTIGSAGNNFAWYFRNWDTAQTGVINRLVITNGADVVTATWAGITHTGMNITATLAVAGTQVIGARVIDARCDDAINSGDATTDGVIDSLRDAMITHGLIAAA